MLNTESTTTPNHHPSTRDALLILSMHTCVASKMYNNNNDNDNENTRKTVTQIDLTQSS